MSQPDPTASPARGEKLSPQQWKSGIAAWLGWLFDGLDMHLYTLVAASFVAQLILVDNPADPGCHVGRLCPCQKGKMDSGSSPD